VHRGRLRVIANLSDAKRTLAVDVREVLIATGGIETHSDATVTIDAQSAAVVRAG
jgi:hypothetical protein